MRNAGDFSTWLRDTRRALLAGTGTVVECGTCRGCCRSSYFIHIAPQESSVLHVVRKELLVPAPGLPAGHVLMGYDTSGRCPMLTDGECSIYDHRPQTCRDYDCRVFAAAGIDAGGDERAEINQRVREWTFTYPAQRDRDEQGAVREAAAFIRTNEDRFAQEQRPVTESQVAILAIKAYELFLSPPASRSDAELVRAILEECEAFDASRPRRRASTMTRTLSR
jgi:Fe-S-cluster containining protein